MHFPNFLATTALLASSVNAQVKGFNYGSTNGDGSPKVLSQWESSFNTAKNLEGTSGFTSARLFTTIQGGTTNSPIEAIQAAINTQTTLLLGLWASAGEATFENELQALTNAITQYGQSFADLVVGISIGSEDLYRVSVVGIERSAGLPGASPSTLSSYISQARQAISNTLLSSKPIGHVDTWTAWVNGSNSAVVDAVDFLGMDAYPFYETDQSATIDNAMPLFYSALDQCKAAGKGKEVWITETGWPTTGDTFGLAVPSVSNAAKYWQDVGCGIFGAVNTWWYQLAGDAFAVTDGTTAPLYSLTCPAAGKRAVEFAA